MNEAIYNPLKDYDDRFKALHLKHVTDRFEELAARSGVDAAENRRTVTQYTRYKESLPKIRRKRNWLRFLRVLLFLTVLLIPLAILAVTPHIRRLKSDLETAEQRTRELLQKANAQMAPLNQLLTERESLSLIEKTLPLLRFAPCFTAEQEEDMTVNYDFSPKDDQECSTLDVLSGHYNENPFLFESRLIHKMGTELYHGYKTISWTETYRDSDGKVRTRVRTQTLHATLSKPKPFYHTQAVLHYCAQGGPDLCFTRDATNLDEKSERAIERYVKRGERKLQRKNDRAVRKNDDFVSMSNSEFEVLFDALDRTNEVQFRTLFTPLAQTNMVDLLLAKNGYGDDFHFIKRRRTNTIITQHSQGRALSLLPADYATYSFDLTKQLFTQKNEGFFKAVYFDFAPALAIPIYQERPVHSLKPIPDLSQHYSQLECEALSNKMDLRFTAHPATKTSAILKASFLRAVGEADQISVKAYSYDIAKRLDIVPMLGGDGRMHGVPVPWDEYLPLEAESTFHVSKISAAGGSIAMATRNDLSIYH